MTRSLYAVVNEHLDHMLQVISTYTMYMVSAKNFSHKAPSVARTPAIKIISGFQIFFPFDTLVCE